MRRAAAVLIAAAAASACTPGHDRVIPSRVSPVEYADATCGQLSTERAFLEARLAELAPQVDADVDRDRLVLAVGGIYAWRRARLNVSPEMREFAVFSGALNAVEKARQAKECGMAARG